MRIIRVTIHGFKTFARSTEFIFDPGTTAVVGPNGSGKSNIVDAIRWCLGEQSFSLLRSKKTADVIFAGSDKRPRLGMAEVTITLDNSENEIPIDFTEVQITRRAYRDGDNEYLVNGQRVRLQDVIDLISHTGLGKRTYSVVGQGLIDRALSMAPEERRSLFEEAAGITGYQIKRTTALRRLDATQQNLVRVRDIVAELSPRLGYLRKQAERAHERQQVVQDLQLLLRDWYGYRWHTTLQRLADHRLAEQAARAAVTTRQGALAELSARIDAARTRQRELRAGLADLHAQAGDVHRRAESVGRETAVAHERIRQLRARREDAEREVAVLQVQREAAAERMAELQAAEQEATALHAERLAAAGDLQRAVGERQQLRQQHLAAVEQARRDLRRRQEQRTESAARRAQLDERRTTLLAEQAQQQTARTAAEQEVAAAAQALAAAEQEAAAADRDLRTLQADIQAGEQRLAALRAELRKAEEARQAADRALDRLQTRHDLLSRLRDEGAGYAQGVRSVLQAHKRGSLTGILGTVATLVRVPDPIEKAIVTALGGALQNVIAQRWDDASAAIDFLKRQNGGRATFLPLDRLSVLPAIPAPRAAGILGNAADLVEYDRAIAPAVQQLLNRTWVAETLAAGRSALDALGNGPRPTVVTVAGEIIRPGGAVTGGSDAGGGDDSLLARERELRSLPAQIEAAAGEAKRAATLCSEQSSQGEQTRLQVDQARQRLADADRREKQLRRQVEEVRRRADRAAQALRWQEERLAQSAAELTGIAERTAHLETALADYAAQADAAQAGLSDAEAAVAAAGADELLAELAERRAAAAEAQGTLRSRQALLESTARTLQSVTDQARAKQGQIATLTHEAETLTAQIADLTAQETAYGTEIATLQAQIDPVEAELAELDAALVAEQAVERQQQQALRKEESAWNTTQLHLQRSEDVLHQLRGEIEQDLGLVALEQSEAVAYQPPLPLEAFVEQLPVVESVPDGMEEEVRDLRARLGRLGSVNPEAPREFAEAAERHEFLITQSADLEAAVADLQKIIAELDERMEVELRRTFEAVSKEFTRLFQQLFHGGTAQLELTDPDRIADSGVEIIARPPGKRPQSLALLSGGERSLSAVALIFAILRVSPTPFCVLDEVDAALDEANIDRFRLMLEEMSQDTQFIIVTHNRRTLEGANTIYGVTMGSDGVSRVMSLRLEGDKILSHTPGSTGPDEPVPPELAQAIEM